jgi:hypothetical protein
MSRNGYKIGANNSINQVSNRERDCDNVMNGHRCRLALYQSTAVYVLFSLRIAVYVLCFYQ